MSLKDPFAAYNAASNVEAHLVCGLLRDAGIQAVVIEDVSQVGVWLGGMIAEIHKPQVWIERTDIEQAGLILAQYDQQNAKRRANEQGDDGSSSPIEVVCEDCGRRSTFPSSQAGSTQNCPHCGSYVDVGDVVDFEGWEDSADDDTV